MFKWIKKAENYATLEKDGERVAQVMRGGMFGNATVVIDNHGECNEVRNIHELQQEIDRVVKRAS